MASNLHFKNVPFIFNVYRCCDWSPNSPGSPFGLLYRGYAKHNKPLSSRIYSRDPSSSSRSCCYFSLLAWSQLTPALRAPSTLGPSPSKALTLAYQTLMRASISHAPCPLFPKHLTLSKHSILGALLVFLSPDPQLTYLQTL